MDFNALHLTFIWMNKYTGGLKNISQGGTMLKKILDILI